MLIAMIRKCLKTNILNFNTLHYITTTIWASRSKLIPRTPCNSKSVGDAVVGQEFSTVYPQRAELAIRSGCGEHAQEFEGAVA